VFVLKPDAIVFDVMGYRMRCSRLAPRPGSLAFLPFRSMPLLQAPFFAIRKDS